MPRGGGWGVGLDIRAGIAEHGLFINMARDVIVAGADGVRHLQALTTLFRNSHSNAIPPDLNKRPNPVGATRRVARSLNHREL